MALKKDVNHQWLITSYQKSMCLELCFGEMQKLVCWTVDQMDWVQALTKSLSLFLNYSLIIYLLC